jgi:hypothetical protein
MFTTRVLCLGRWFFASGETRSIRRATRCSQNFVFGDEKDGRRWLELGRRYQQPGAAAIEGRRYAPTSLATIESHAAIARIRTWGSRR